jgi:5-formyltetrahydrofolate cyclo-ligase
MEYKRRQRQKMNQRLRGLSSRDIADMSRCMCKLFIESDFYKNSNLLMAYLAMPFEADPSAIIEAALSSGKDIATPVIDRETQTLIPARLRTLTNGLIKNYYGILEPEEIEPVKAADIDAVIVPGLAFDRHGGRLGRGGGFYDKLLADDSIKAIRCGLAFSTQIIDKVPTQEHDKQMDILITDKEIIATNSRFKI